MRNSAVSGCLGICTFYVSVFWGAVVHADILVVPDDYLVIQDAITATVPGDTVLVMPGTYVENLVCAEGVHLVSQQGPGVTRIDGNYAAITVQAGSVSSGTIAGFNIVHGGGWNLFLANCGSTFTVAHNILADSSDCLVSRYLTTIFGKQI